MNNINMDYLKDKLKDHGELMNDLERTYGYIEEYQVDELIDIFGRDFKVVAKDFDGNRNEITLDDLINGEHDNINEVFIDSNDYRTIFENIK